MAAKRFIVNFRQLAFMPSIRLWAPLEYPKTKYPLVRIKNFISTIESGSRPKGGIVDIDEGAISLGAEQISSEGSVDLSSMPLVPLEFYETSEKGKVRQKDILICKDGALTGKACFVDIDFPIKEVMVNEHVYLIRSRHERTNHKFFFYLLASGFVQRQIRDLAYRKKGQPGLNQEHLCVIKVPDIPRHVQDQVVPKIELVEQNINTIKSQLKSPQVVMNRVFAREFGFNLDAVHDFEAITSLNLSRALSYRNEYIRSSYRWHKLRDIQKVLYKNVGDICKLGKYIKSIQNGWSPKCNETDDLYAVLGIDALSADTRLKLDNLKYTNEVKNNIDEFFIKQGDFLVSRGNTVDLVAMASVVNFAEDEVDIVFPDLLIRIYFDEAAVHTKYLGYLFNSIIGRLYFKYCAKGKNQTMVKISQAELTNFYVPLPSKALQEKIVQEIYEELSQQNPIKQRIRTERDKIDKIIDGVIY
jgi:type I restriction enzyme S subunit